MWLSQQTFSNLADLEKSYWVKLVIVTILLRIVVGFILLNDMPLISDASSYYQEAIQMLANFPGETAYYWPPGTTFLLSGLFYIFGSSVLTAKIITLIISVSYCLLVVILAASVVKDRKVIQYTGWLAACYPSFIMMSAQPYSHHFTALFSLIALIIVLNFQSDNKAKYLKLIVLGVVLGVSALVRPSALTLLILIIGYVCLDFKSKNFGSTLFTRIKYAAIIGLTSFICILPVLQFNSDLGAGFNISTNNERNLFLGNNKYTPHYKTGHFGQVPSSDLEPEIGNYLDDMRGQGTLADRKRMAEASVDYILSEPMIFLKRTFNRIKAFWGVDYVMSREIQKYYELSSIQLAGLLAFEAGGYCLIMALLFFSIFTLPKMKAWQHWILIILAVAFYQAPYALAFSAGIYHFPIMAIVIVVAAQILKYPWRQWGEVIATTKQRCFLAVLFIAFALLQLEYLYVATQYAG